MTKIIKKEKTVEHPMEEIFDLAPGTTVVEFNEVQPTEIVVAPTYDDKDLEIEAQFQEVYDIAMGNVTEISDQMDRVEGKYKARIGEVSATMLGVALSAAREKAQLKAHKDKVVPVGAPGSAVGPEGTIVADRNELLRAFVASKKQQQT